MVIADRHLADIARTAAGMSLAKLHAEQRAGVAGPWDEAIERREATLRATATVPHGFAAVLPPIPPVPHLEARYRRLAGDVAVWTETHNQPRPRRTLTPIETAIGARPASNRAAASEWDTLANRATRLAVDVTRHHLDERRPELRPLTADPGSWLRGWLDDLAGDGRLATLNVDDLLDVIDDPTNSTRRTSPRATRPHSGDDEHRQTPPRTSTQRPTRRRREQRRRDRSGDRMSGVRSVEDLLGDVAAVLYRARFGFLAVTGTLTDWRIHRHGTASAELVAGNPPTDRLKLWANKHTAGAIADSFTDAGYDPAQPTAATAYGQLSIDRRWGLRLQLARIDLAATNPAGARRSANAAATTTTPAGRRGSRPSA